jgi:hypothetical protein
MKTVIKLLGISILVAGLAACDGKTTAPTAPAADKDKAAATSTTATSAGQAISLLDGKLSFTLPQGMSDQSGKMGTQSNNMHVYANNSGQTALIVIISDPLPDDLATLADRMQKQQTQRDPSLSIVTNSSLQISGQTLQQIDSIMTSNGQKSYSSVILAKLPDHTLTMQFSAPANDTQQAKAQAQSIISSLQIK